MACNKIGQMFEQTQWRPTHYVKVDHSRFGGDDWQAQIEQAAGSGAKMLLWKAFKDGDPAQEITGLGDLPNTTWIERCQRHHYFSVGNEKAAQSWHLPEICTAYNSINVMAQWAVLLGYDEIYLLGCDGRYGNGKDDHFSADYYREVDADYKARNETNVAWAHRIIWRSCPIPIYDATINGALTIYKKVDLRSVLDGKENLQSQPA